MEVKPGYLHTDVGVIPDDWSLMTYGDVFNFLSTATYSRSELTEGDDVKYVHYGDIHTKWDGYLDFSEEYLPTLESGKTKAYHLIKEGDIIMADASEDYGGVGKSVEVKNIGNNKAISGLHTFLLRDNNEVFVNGFKGYIHCNEIIKKQFYRYATGLKVFGISKNILKSIQIPVPPKAEQTAIATALSDADALIQSLEKLIAKKRLIKQGAMQKLLKPKEGWVVKRLGEVANMFSGGTPNTSVTEYYRGYIPWIISSDLNKKIIYNVKGKISQSGLINSSAKMIKPNTLLIALYGATAGVTAISKIEAAINQAVLAIAPDSSINNLFLFYLLSYMKESIIINYTQGGQPNLSKQILQSLEVTVPPFDEQNKISTYLSDIEKEIAALESKLEKYKQIKQGMMQNLLTGKIRLV